MDKAEDPFDKDTVIDVFVKVVLPTEVRGLYDNEQLMINIFIAWATTAYRTAIIRYKKPEPEDAVKERRAKQAKAKEAREVAAVKLREKRDRGILKKAKALLLDMLMPNGKTLRDCSGADLRTFNDWTAKLASMVRPDQIVGDVLSDKEVRRFAPEEWA
jgi:hypothetical protein